MWPNGPPARPPADDKAVGPSAQCRMWLTDESELTPVAGHTATALGRLILVWGGYFTSRTPINAAGVYRRDQSYRDPSVLYVYDTSMGKWLCVRRTAADRPHAVHPPPNSGACAVRLRNKMYVFGGFIMPDYEEADGRGTSSLYSLDLTTMCWSRIRPRTGDRPTPRHKLVGWHYHNKLYFFGGFGPPPDLATAMTRHTSRTYLIGGQFPVDEDLSVINVWNNQTVVFDLTKEVWSLLPCTGDVPSARAAHAGCLLDAHTAVIFGGRHRAQRLNDVYALDLRTNVWSKVEPVSLAADGRLPQGRSWHCMGAMDDGESALVFGGFTTDRQPLGDVWQLRRVRSDAADKWYWVEVRSVEAAVDKRLWHTGVAIDGVLYAHGGYSRDIITVENETSSFHKDVIKMGSVSAPPLTSLCAQELAKPRLRSLYPDEKMLSHLPVSLAAKVLYARGKCGSELLHPSELMHTLESTRRCGGAVHSLAVGGILNLKRWRRQRKHGHAAADGSDKPHSAGAYRLTNVYDLLSL